MLNKVIPVLHVADTVAAEEFYCRGLGFRLDFRVPGSPASVDPAYIGVSRDAAALHLSSHAGAGVAGAAVYLLVDSVDAIFEELLGRGLPIALSPTDQTWGMRELYVRDPDGNSVRFGAPIATPGG